tara:strand:+ start:476 stop:1870 length:1395 start_codon:yes stop_codon:yes gene_type:complete
MNSRILFLLTATACLPCGAEDWPTYQHDSARSAITGEKLGSKLTEAWVYRPKRPPHIAWPGAAKWDGWAKIYGLKDRMIFDRVFHVAVVGDSVYFGSSSEDKIICLDTATGKTRWKFYTEGPVRLAPTVAGGKLYAGSDDGLVYCLNAADGVLEWKYRPGPGNRRLPGNERMISMWPVRTSVLVRDGVAFCGAGVFPWEGVYLCALDTGSGKELWKTGMKSLPAQGYLLASSTRLYVTTGRERPVVFDSKTGRKLYQVTGGGGGTYALVTGDMLVYGPGKTGEMSVYKSNRKDQLASFKGNQMIVTPKVSYLMTDTRLSALDRSRYLVLYEKRERLNTRKGKVTGQLKKIGKSSSSNAGKKLREELGSLNLEIDKLTGFMKKCFNWQVPSEYPHSMILTRDKVFAGGKGRVAGFETRKGRISWKAEVKGNAYGLAAASGRLYVSTDDGSIYCFTAPGGGGKETR